MDRMAHRIWIPVAVSLVLLVLIAPLWADEDVSITPDVVYGHKHGMALTMDVFQPKERNGVGALFMVSGGWYSTWAAPEQTMSLFSHYWTGDSLCLPSGMAVVLSILSQRS